MYSRPVSRTLRPWKNCLLERRLLERLAAGFLVPRRLVAAAFLAAEERLALLAARVLAAFFAAVERLLLLRLAFFEDFFEAFFEDLLAAFLDDFRAVDFRAVDFLAAALRGAAFRVDFFRPFDAMVIPPEPAVSFGPEVRRRGRFPVSTPRAAALIALRSASDMFARIARRRAPMLYAIPLLLVGFLSSRSGIAFVSTVPYSSTA